MTAKSLLVTAPALFTFNSVMLFQQEMGSKKKMGYKCRIAGVMLLLIGSIAALVAVAVIQDKLTVKEYGIEVKTHTYTLIYP